MHPWGYASEICQIDKSKIYWHIFYDLLFVTKGYKYGDDVKLWGYVQQI
jgi:hypothetical protein